MGQIVRLPIGHVRPREAQQCVGLHPLERKQREPIKIVSILAARPGKADELGALLTGMAIRSRNEPGIIRYDIWRDQSEPRRFVIDELYRNEDAMNAHREASHFIHDLAMTHELAERSALALSPAHVA